VQLSAPSLLVLGEAAIELTPDTTVVPESTGLTKAPSLQLRVESLEVHERHVAGLDRFAGEQPNVTLYLGGHPGALSLADVPQLVAPQLRKRPTNCRLLPALVQEQPRLLLAYRRPDGTCAALLSGPDLQPWLERLNQLLAPGDGARPGPNPATTNSATHSETPPPSGLHAIAAAIPCAFTPHPCASPTCAPPIGRNRCIPQGSTRSRQPPPRARLVALANARSE
jgi:hypothetical protein